MSLRISTAGTDILSALQWASLGLVGGAGVTLAVATTAGILGLLPVLDLPLRIGETTFAGAGLVVQAGLSALLLAMAATLPAGVRVLRLERSHRDFQLCMSDVAEAYRVCHAADRAGAFSLHSEFDAVKERFRYLRAHPDLGRLEPDVLEVAAEMSQASRELATTYSDDKVARARAFLAARQEELARFEARIERALATSDDIRRHKEAVETEEAELEMRLARMETEFADILANLGFSRTGRSVVSLPPKGNFAAE